MNSTNNDPGLIFKTILFPAVCCMQLLQRMAGTDMALKHDQNWAMFSSFRALPMKITKQVL